MSLSLSPFTLPAYNWRTVLLALLILLIIATVAFAWWYYEWRYFTSWQTQCACQEGQCIMTVTEEHKWACHDGSGYCYDTGEVRYQYGECHL